MSARSASLVAALLLVAPAIASATDVSNGECSDVAAQQSPLRPIHQIFDAKSPLALIEEVLAPYVVAGSTATLDHATADHLVELASHEHPRTAATSAALRNAVQALGDRIVPADAARLTTAAGTKTAKPSIKAAAKSGAKSLKAVRTRRR